MLISRGVQGIIAVDTALEHSVQVPTVAIAGHRRIKGVTNVLLNHYSAAQLALTHLHSLGHRCIAFMQGQPFSSDSEERWNSIVKVASQLGLSIDPELVVRLNLDTTSPGLGYPVIEQLLTTKKPFTALVAFNDVAALGSIRALQDSNMEVPKNVSVIGFDDIMASAYTMPRLTTIRQPLTEMGRIATQVLLEEIDDADTARQQIEVEPELIVRESTGPAAPRYL